MVFDTITREIANRKLTGRREFSYVLPRACGSTSFLVQLAKTEAMKGDTRVAYFNRNNNMVYYVKDMMDINHTAVAQDSVIDILSWQDITKLNFRGRRGYNVIIFDGVSVDPKHRVEDFGIINSLLYDGGYMIHIDSV